MGAAHRAVTIKKPLTPTTISGLVGWWRADSFSFADGTSIQTWPDQSGNGNDATQFTGANQPILKLSIQNQRPVVRFNGTSTFLNLTSTIATPLTIFVVGAITISPAALPRDAVLFGTGGTPGGVIFGRGFGSTNWGTLGSTGDNIDSGTDLVAGSFNVLEETSDGTTLIIYQNGTSKATYNSHPSSGSNAIMAKGGLDGLYVACDLAEILVYNSVLSTGNRQLMELYLKGKYRTP